MAGAYAGARLATHLPSALLLVGFGLLMAAAATTMIRSCRRPLRCVPGTGRLPLLLGLGATVGLITGMVGRRWRVRHRTRPRPARRAGARLADRVPAQLLRTGFGWFLTAMATLVLVEQAPVAVRHALAGTAGGRIALTAGCAALAMAAARHVHACRTLAASRRR